MRKGRRLPFPVAAGVVKAAKGIKLVLFDVDGVLTDGRLIFDHRGEEYKAFYSRDGHGIKMLQHTGVEVGIITGRNSPVVARRAAELGITHVFQGCREKWTTCRTLLAQLGLAPQAVAFVGDDVVDLPILLQAGLAVAVQDAHHLVKAQAHWVTPSNGGRGAAREVCELIMHAQGTYAGEIERYYAALTP